MISKKTKYALIALEVLAKSQVAGPVLISDLAEQGRIPKKFLEAILLGLRNAGILHSKKGKGGGYALAKKPGEIKIGSVMRIFEGALAPLPCLSKGAYHACEECRDEATCGIRLVMEEAHQAQFAILDATSLEDMMERAHAAHGSLSYNI